VTEGVRVGVLVGLGVAVGEGGTGVGGALVGLGSTVAGGLVGGRAVAVGAGLSDLAMFANRSPIGPPHPESAGTTRSTMATAEITTGAVLLLRCIGPPLRCAFQ
jgi:hypothetical protein